MKMKRYKNGEKDVITLSENLNILETLKSIKCDYKEETGSEPLGFIMGPQDYVSLVKELHDTSRYFNNEHGIVYPDHVLGLPIRLKEFNGVELEINTDEFYRYL